MTKLALVGGYGSSRYPKCFSTSKGNVRERLATFLEQHRSEFDIVDVNELKSGAELEQRIIKNKYGVCVVTGHGDDKYYTRVTRGYINYFGIVEVKDGVYWTVTEYDGSESLKQYRIKNGSFELEEVRD